MIGTALFDGETLHFGYADTSLGTILVAEDVGGAVTLFIGDNRLKLLRDLRDAFPSAQLLCAPYSLARTIAKARALVDGPNAGIECSHNLRTSPLGVAIWNALQAVPAAETRTE